MKLISINTWGGRMFEPLMDFIKSQAETTDIFCFQELYFNPLPHHTVFGIRPDLALQIKKALPDFSVSERLGGIYQEILAYVSRRWYDIAENEDATVHDRDIHIGEAIFVKKHLEILDEGGCHTYVSDDESSAEDIMPSTGNFQYVVVQARGERYTVGNVHGLWLPGTKRDTPKRIEQSQVLDNFIKVRPGKKILCGDFNLEPDTKSVAILEAHMRNLIKEYTIKATRSRYYKDMEKYKDYIADYIFVSRDVEVKDFRVLKNEVSDHLSLMLKFS